MARLKRAEIEKLRDCIKRDINEKLYSFNVTFQIKKYIIISVFRIFSLSMFNTKIYNMATLLLDGTLSNNLFLSDMRIFL